MSKLDLSENVSSYVLNDSGKIHLNSLLSNYIDFTELYDISCSDVNDKLSLSGFTKQTVLIPYFKKDANVKQSSFKDMHLSEKTDFQNLKTISDSAFETNCLLKTVCTSAETIGQYAFSNCELLESVDIGSPIQSIGFNAFSYDSNLKSLRIHRFKKDISSNFPYGANSSIIEFDYSEEPQKTGYVKLSATVLRNVLNDGSDLYANKSVSSFLDITHLNVADDYSVKESLSQQGLQSSDTLIPIFNSTVSVIDNTAFKDYRLWHFSIPDSVLSINQLAFAENPYICELNLCCIRYIGNEAFRECTALSDVYIGKDIAYIGSNAFYSYDSALTNLTIDKKKSQISTNWSYGIDEQYIHVLSDDVQPEASAILHLYSGSTRANVGNGKVFAYLEDYYLEDFHQHLVLDLTQANDGKYVTFNDVQTQISNCYDDERYMYENVHAYISSSTSAILEGALSGFIANGSRQVLKLASISNDVATDWLDVTYLGKDAFLQTQLNGNILLNSWNMHDVACNENYPFGLNYPIGNAWDLEYNKDTLISCKNCTDVAVIDFSINDSTSRAYLSTLSSYLSCDVVLCRNKCNVLFKYKDINSAYSYKYVPPFLCNSKITKIVAPFVSAVGYVFYDCPNLSDINMPNLKLIGYDEDSDYSKASEYVGFINNCSSLTSIFFQNLICSDIYLTKPLIQNCNRLQSINLPALKQFEWQIAVNCQNLTQLNLTELISYSTYGIISHCSSLTSLNLPSIQSLYGAIEDSSNNLKQLSCKNLTCLYYNSFKLNLHGISSIYVDNNVLKSFDTEAGNNTLIANTDGNVIHLLIGNDITSYSNPNVTELKSCSIAAKSLKNLELVNLTCIGPKDGLNALYHCSISSLKVDNDVLHSISSNGIADQLLVNSDETSLEFVLPTVQVVSSDTILNSWQLSSNECNSALNGLRTINLPNLSSNVSIRNNNVLSIILGNRNNVCIQSCTNLHTLILNSIQNLNSGNKIQNCTNLKHTELNSLHSISDNGIYRCNFEHLQLPSLKSMQNYGINECTISSLDISCVEEINSYGIANTKIQEILNLPSSLTSMNEHSFSNCTMSDVSVDSSNYRYFSDVVLDECKKYYNGHYNGIFEYTTNIKYCGVADLCVGYIHTGNPIEPKPTITNSYSGKTLSLNVDYELQYENNIDIGTATLSVIGIGLYQYSDVFTYKFKISNNEQELFRKLEYVTVPIDVYPGIRTGYIPTKTTVISCDFSFDYMLSTYSNPPSPIYQASEFSYNGGIGLYFKYPKRLQYIFYGIQVKISSANEMLQNIRYNTIQNYDKLTVNNTNYVNSDHDDMTCWQLCLFDNGFNAGTYYSKSYARYSLYKFAVSNGTSIVLNYVPAIDPYDTVCLYDLVSKKFIYSYDKKCLIGGPEVI